MRRQPLSKETLESVPPSVLIEVIVQQQALIDQQQEALNSLAAEVAKLKEQLGSDSKTTSKPPSSDLLKKPEKAAKKTDSKRLIRIAVTKRKVSGGSRSMLRFEQTADLLSVIQTCRRQGRSALFFFQQALMAQHDKVTDVPSLIPQSAT